MDYKETIKERLKVLPEQLRAFVLDESWRRDAEKIGRQFELDEEKYASFENEIFLVLICLETPGDFAENVQRELGMDAGTAKWIAEDADREIFNKVENDIVSMWQSESSEQNEEATNAGVREEPVKVENELEEAPAQKIASQPFEQIILNQAKAMQPVREAPGNLPAGEQGQNEPPNAIHNYISDDDPYREPLV